MRAGAAVVVVDGATLSAAPGGLRAGMADLENVWIPASWIVRRQIGCDALLVGVRCVIVDDNPVFLEAARALLERGGLPVAAVAATGAEAVRQAHAHQPDVVLVDVFLDGESGFELARRLADDGEPPHPLIILISTLARDDLVDLINDSPAAGFMSKRELSAQAVRCVVNARRPR